MKERLLDRGEERARPHHALRRRSRLRERCDHVKGQPARPQMTHQRAMQERQATTGIGCWTLQGYLAHKKLQPPLEEAVSYERGTWKDMPPQASSALNYIRNTGGIYEGPSDIRKTCRHWHREDRGVPSDVTSVGAQATL